MVEKSTQDTAVFASMVAKKQGWIINRDVGFTASLIEGLTVNFNRYGYYLCPCRDSEGSRTTDADVICPCTYAKEDVASAGHCFCALYLSPDFADSGQEPSGIPDRRYLNG
jgi:ferredoxin-thioredoxin reductase catalytic chain